MLQNLSEMVALKAKKLSHFFEVNLRQNFGFLASKELDALNGSGGSNTFA